MRSLLAVVLVSALCLVAPASRVAAATPQAPDRILVEGLDAALTNGVDAALRIWFADRPLLATEMREKLNPIITRNMGTVIDTEVVAIQAVSKRVTRYYVAIYFQRCPLWLRVERYANNETAFYLPLRFSTNPDEILPGYITEFQP